jgi:two-component system NtrC family sensor kinase
MNTFAIAGLLLGITCLLLAVFIFIYRKTKLHLIWIFFNLAVAIWGFGCFMVGIASTESDALFGWRFAHVGGLFVAVFFYHMVCAFYDLKHKKRIIAVYSIGLSSLWLNVMTDQFINKTRFVFNLLYNKATWLYSIILCLWIYLVIWSFIKLLKFLPITKGIKRTQTLYMILGFLTGFLGGISTFLPEFKIDVIYPLGNFTIPLYCIISTYAILRYRLLDISIVIKRTAVYSLSAGLLVSFFIVMVLATTKYLTHLAGITSFAITAVFAVLIALLFNPLRNRIQIIIDKIFYKKTYDYYSTIQKVSHELASTFNLGKIYSFIGDTISSALGLKNIYLLSLFPDEKYRTVYLTTHGKKDEIKDKKAVNIDRESLVREYNIEDRIQEGEGAMNGRSEIIKLLKESKDVVIREELPQIHEIEQEVVDKVNTDLKPFKGEAVVPVFIDGKLEFLIVLGEKLSGDIFSNEDIKLLHTISDQTAIAIKNARLYTDKIRSERLASIGMISATFAHEIKNPLTSIKTFAQLLPEKHSDTEFRENFSRIVTDGVNRIDSLIKDLLDFSSGKISIEMSTINVTGLMDSVIDEVLTQLQLKNKKISIEKDYKNIEVDMLGDGKRMRQAFANIILNGCQAIPENRENGKIIVSIDPGENSVGITIADNGDGIAPEDVPRIFEPFFSTKTIGAGLGLAITKKIIEDHYGKIEADSILKKGTTFRITLPVKKMGAKVGNLSTA